MWHTSTIMVGVLHSSCAVVVHCITVAMMSRVATTPTDAKVTAMCPATRLRHTVLDVSTLLIFGYTSQLPGTGCPRQVIHFQYMFNPREALWGRST